MTGQGRQALVIGASGGIGAAVAAELRERGVAVSALSRREDGLDVTDEASVAEHLGALEGPFELIVVATGALVSTRKAPEKALDDLGADELAAQLRLNALGPALVLKHARRLMPRQGRSVFAVLSARVGSIGDNRLGGWYSYRASKAALNALVHGAAVEVGRTRKDAILVCLHPGTVATAFTADYPGHDKLSPAEAASSVLDVVEALEPKQSGGFFDYAGKEIPLVSRLILVLGDQLDREIAALGDVTGDDVVVMAEVAEEASYVPHHPKKIAFLFAAMRKFAASLREEGLRVRYTTLDDPDNAGSITGELLRAAERHGAGEVIATEPGEWRLIEALRDCPLKVTQRPDTRFLASHAEFEAWAEGRSELRMEWFYREMRRKTDLLMEGGAPAGGKWNFDHDNRRPNPKAVSFGGPMRFTPDEITEDVLYLVEGRFGDNFGDLRPFWFATERGQARRALARFVSEALPDFGDYQDAMLSENAFLYHGVIGLYLNAGLLRPLEVCRAAAAAWRAGDAPINAVEGFIRQIIGWREYVRGIYFLQGPDYARRNGLGHGRSLPAFYWSGETKMHCIATTIAQTRENAYAHHIQRLMVTGNFALLAGIEPQQVQHWYMSVYADAYEWVMSANVIGMSQFADGGLMASKPYVSSGNYIDRMSDYCSSCAYDVKTKVGEGACPFNLLYWAFLARHRERFASNPRMANMYATLARMNPEKRAAVLMEAETFLNRMAQGALV